jgi:hypothetical protein
MRFLRYVLRSMNILNLLLVTATVLLAIYLFPFVTMKLTYGSPKIREAIGAQLDKPEQGQSPPPSEYTLVAEQNVFHPERKIPPETIDEKDKEKQKPEIVLYGTLIADGMRLAYLEDRKSPQSTAGRGNRQTVAKQGEMVSGYLLKSIEADRIVLVRGQEQIIALVNDPQKRTQKAAPNQPGGGTSTPSRPVAVSSVVSSERANLPFTTSQASPPLPSVVAAERAGPPSTTFRVPGP